MTAAELVAAARAAGCIFRHCGDRILYRIPRSSGAEALVCALQARKAEVAAFLQAEFGDLLLRALAPRLAGDAAASAITRALAPDGRGGIVVTSRTLDGRRVVFVRDEQVPVPEKYRELVRFTRAELEQIAGERWSADRLRAVVMAKEGLRTAEEPDHQAHLVPATEAAEMSGTMVPARGWLARSAEPAAAPSPPARIGPTLEELCEEAQAWLWRGFRGPSPEEP